jgi:hypothetical protein
VLARCTPLMLLFYPSKTRIGNDFKTEHLTPRRSRRQSAAHKRVETAPLMKRSEGATRVLQEHPNFAGVESHPETWIGRRSSLLELRSIRLLRALRFETLPQSPAGARHCRSLKDPWILTGVRDLEHTCWSSSLMPGYCCTRCAAGISSALTSPAALSHSPGCGHPDPGAGAPALTASAGCGTTACRAGNHLTSGALNFPWRSLRQRARQRWANLHVPGAMFAGQVKQVGMPRVPVCATATLPGLIRPGHSNFVRRTSGQVPRILHQGLE